ncbi:hypothetical protein EGW08_009134 [Elysia chlorotica]|uniref:Centrosomin N-terminal motif 1 domain-containing protein n=1 Tax=Elysia chlorotica TaxID=188477 RepID=A0A3S1BG16_ELYCH|nr:hypothetical protein EGW08_009134 [Elysia chlorotica]
MDETATGASTLPVDLEGSLDPGQLPEITLRNDTHWSSMASFDNGFPQDSKFYSGRLSPARKGTIKEYDKQISDLKKENFNLKTRIYYMDQRMQQRYGDGQDIYKLNVELQVQVEKLKKDLIDKQDLIFRADSAIETLRANCKQEEESIRNRILSEVQEEMKRLQAQLEDTKKECEKYRKEFYDAGDEIKALQQDLNTMNADLCRSNRDKSDLADKLKTTEFEVQHLTAQLKLTEQSKSEKEKENSTISQRLKDLNDQFQDSQKEISRNKRDLQNLSTLLEDHSHIDSTSFLEPVRKQDEIEDALDSIKRKDNKIGELEESLKQKENMVGNLEDALRAMEKKLKDLETEKKKTDSEIEHLRKYDAKINKSFQCTVKTLANKDTELKNTTEKLNAARENIKSLEAALKEAEMEKTKTLGDLTKELTDLEVDNRRLKLQLTEAEATIENLAMSLGKKEGELSGFQDQLKRAMDALRSSDDAVEALHNQLKAERTEFDRKLKEVSKHQMSPNRHSETHSGKDQLSDLEKMEALRKAQEVFALAEELEALKAELHGKDLKIQTLENSRVWYESHSTVHHFAERKTDAGELPLDLLVDLKSLLQQVQKEMGSLSGLRNLLAQFNKSGDTASSAELLLSEISSVQKIYRQLEGGVEKNSQLHQALLNSLRGERRQSDSPDSNSCQDGGYNLGPSDHVLETPDKHRQQPGASAGIETASPGQVDRSFQTGTALSHADQWVQTSPGPTLTAEVGTSFTDTGHREDNTRLKSPLSVDQAQHSKPWSDQLRSPGKFPNLVPAHRVRHSHVHFADNSNEPGQRSLTDDAKGIHPLGAENLPSADYFNCSPGVLFDEDNFDVRAHDRGSSARFYARSTDSPQGQTSVNSAVLSSYASNVLPSSSRTSAHSATSLIPKENEPYHTGFPDPTNFEEKHGPLTPNGHQEDNDEAHNRSCGIIDFNNHRSGRAGVLKGDSFASQCEKNLQKDQAEEIRREKAETESEERFGERGEKRSRRNSWADELEQYRVHDQDRGSDHQAQSDQPDQEGRRQQHQIIGTMSAVELRDLVAQLQLDLVDADKEKKALQEKLRAQPKTQSVVNGHKAASKSKIPRLHASSSCYSTTSEDSDQVDHSHKPGSVGDVLDNWAGQQFHPKGIIPRAIRNRTASADREVSTSMQGRLNESHAMIKNLQNKLHATENTVRLLSKKNKAFVSALESAGVSPTVLNRSNSESCLSSFVDASQEKAAVMSSFNSTDRSRRLAYLLSPLKNKREMSGRENARAVSTSVSKFDADLFQSSPPSAITRSPACTIAPSPVKTSDTSALSSASCLNTMQSTAYGVSQTLSGMDISEPGVYFKVPSVHTSSASFKSSKTGSGSPSKTDYLNETDKSQQQLEEQSSPNTTRFAGLKNGSKSPPLSSQCKKQSPSYHQLSESLIDVSAYPDVTYTSLLDGTLLNRLHQMTNMDHSLAATMHEDVSSISVDQLQGRVEHLERVNLTLREEINVYEAIYHSQGTQVSPSFSDDNKHKNPKSDDDILKQHLVEIKKLRQRLERLDITNDPEQLLIFQSHTQQRITRQETMLAHLQQQLVEREERHLQECAQLQHRLARDKVAVGERLEQTIADLRKQLDAQSAVIKDSQQQVQELKLQLEQGEEREKEHDEHMKKVLSEKSELNDDLVKRDKEFLEMEKMMFRLEMAKESAESRCRRMETELEEKDKNCTDLKQEIEDCKENSKCLKEIIVKREKSLQEKVYNLQKVTNEKAAAEQFSREKENQNKRLEDALANLKKEMHENCLTHDNMKMQLQSEIQELKSELRKREDLEARNAFQKAGYESEIQRLTEEKVQMKATHERELDTERMEVRRQIEDLRDQLKDKRELESQLDMLRERVKTIPELQGKVEKLELQLDHKGLREHELRSELDHKISRESELQDSVLHMQESLERNIDRLKAEQEERKKIQQDLKEREEKLKKRDRQLKNLIGQHMKLETTFTKQKNMLKEKSDLVYSQKKQLRLFEVSLTASSQEEKNDVMKQLLKELIATQRQVEELLSRLEQNPLSQPAVRVETFGMGQTTSGAGLTTTITTTSGAGSSASSGQDNVDTVLSVGIRAGSPELYLGSLSPSASEAELDMPTASSVVGSHTGRSASVCSSPLRPVSTNHSPGHPPSSHFPLSPRHLRYYSDLDSELFPGMPPQSMVGSDISSLFAILKLESHEKLRKESSESLVILSSMEARLDDRLRAYKAMAVSESIDYSTLRETSMSCRNLRLCLEEAVKLSASAWITELPPVDARGHFYDPILAEQNENLKRDLTVLRSRHDVLDHMVKEQQGRLQASKERHKNWEQSLYKQLHKTAQDMEKAKENFDAADMVPRKNMSLKVRSPNKSPYKRFDDTV